MTPRAFCRIFALVLVLPLVSASPALAASRADPTGALHRLLASLSQALRSIVQALPGPAGDSVPVKATVPSGSSGAAVLAGDALGTLDPNG